VAVVMASHTIDRMPRSTPVAAAMVVAVVSCGTGSGGGATFPDGSAADGCEPSGATTPCPPSFVDISVEFCSGHADVQCGLDTCVGYWGCQCGKPYQEYPDCNPPRCIRCAGPNGCGPSYECCYSPPSAGASCADGTGIPGPFNEMTSCVAGACEASQSVVCTTDADCSGGDVCGAQLATIAVRLCTGGDAGLVDASSDGIADGGEAGALDGGVEADSGVGADGQASRVDSPSE
jgi:hypothetical protein